MTSRFTQVALATTKTIQMKPVRDPYIFWRNVTIMSVVLYAALVGSII